MKQSYMLTFLNGTATLLCFVRDNRFLSMCNICTKALEGCMEPYEAFHCVKRLNEVHWFLYCNGKNLFSHWHKALLQRLYVYFIGLTTSGKIVTWISIMSWLDQNKIFFSSASDSSLPILPIVSQPEPLHSEMGGK